MCWCYGVVWLGWCGILMQAEAMLTGQHVSDVNTSILRSLGLIWVINHEITQQICRKLLRMDVLTSETCWASNKETIKQVISSWSLFIQLYSSRLFFSSLFVSSDALTGYYPVPYFWVRQYRTEFVWSRSLYVKKVKVTQEGSWERRGVGSEIRRRRMRDAE